VLRLAAASYRMPLPAPGGDAGRGGRVREGAGVAWIPPWLDPRPFITGQAPLTGRARCLPVVALRGWAAAATSTSTSTHGKRVHGHVRTLRRQRGARGVGPGGQCGWVGRPGQVGVINVAE
jgi:hypothetical protein